MQFYTYGNIVRILDQNEALPEQSRMIDVNIDEKTVLSCFDATRPFDAAFIKSFIDILSHSATGFKRLQNEQIKEIAISISKI